MQNPTASLIISFYNKIDSLKLVFAGLEGQTYSDFEVIIADDGSNKSAVDELRQLIKKNNLNTRHIWHEDDGWRKPEMLNKAILAAKSDYLIFIDGDCIPHSHFIEEHLHNRKTGVALVGRRVDLSSEISKWLTPGKVRKGYLEKWGFLYTIGLSLLGKGKNVESGVYIRNNFLRNQINKKPERGMLGSNFSIHKKDLLTINGFDERYKEPGIGEDTDLSFRLELSGVSIHTLKNIAIQYHLFHQILLRSDRNMHLFDETRKNRNYYTSYGINKHP